ncbi:MAG TPA: zinc dependent phospholipase C family protein [Lachnospiraceae bacterium]|nr:zinc dependent phospholipase C family protein [Lachnospiraceae bacterium]
MSLAMYLVDNIDTTELNRYRRSFYIGSILPDCKPSFLTTRHEFDGTFQMIKDRILKLTTQAAQNDGNSCSYMRDLGQIIHYIADYFTYPHNTVYDGNLKDHCIYEKHLKCSLREYIKSGEAARNQKQPKHFETPQALFGFIQKTHEDYLNMKHSVEEDCMSIVRICHQVVISILQLFHMNINSIPVFA